MQLCGCGCGAYTGFYSKTNTRFGHVKGEPKRFLRGHFAKIPVMSPNPSGYCECGCGGLTSRANGTYSKDGITKGENYRFIRGHQMIGKTGSKHPSWTGGRKGPDIKDGYIRVYVGYDHPMGNKNGYALEHRIVLSEIIGRPLTSGEVSHHKNENRSDNRPQNLMLFPDKAAHQSWHNYLDGRYPEPPSMAAIPIVESSRLLIQRDSGDV